MTDRTIPDAVRERLPIYLHYLRGFTGGGKTTISSAALAKGLGLGEVQVRKDLALVSGAGKPKIGYDAAELTSHLESALGIAETNAVIVGAGRLGKALLCYEGFNEFGLHILAAFDKDESKCSFREGGKLVLPIDELKEFCEENEVKIGVICVPEKEAPAVCELLVSCGMKGIWNFAPVRLNVPEAVGIRNENMAASLAVLASSLAETDG